MISNFSAISYPKVKVYFYFWTVTPKYEATTQEYGREAATKNDSDMWDVSVFTGCLGGMKI